MSEEEKRVIKLLKGIEDIRSCTTADDLDEEDAKIILNLIEKQQKEIDYWKKGIQIVDKDHKNYINKQYNKILEKEEIIEKQNKIIDKINSKIEEYEEILDSPIIKEDYKLEVQHIIRVLKELKGEN